MAKGHTEVIDQALAPTCTEAGLTEGMHCSVCKEVLISQEEIEALGHDFDTVVVNPTCTEQGYTTFTCHCGYSYVGDYIGVLGHNYKATTCNNDGTHIAVCENNKEHVMSIACDYNYVRNDNGTKEGYCDCGHYDYTIDENALIVEDGVLVAATDYGKTLTKLVILDGVKEINKGALAGCNSIQSLTVPFVGRNSTDNESAYLGYIFGAESPTEENPTHLTAIPVSLTEVVVTGKTELGYGALAFLPSVERIEIAEGATVAGYGAFAYNLKLKEAKLPESLNNFIFGAFAFCSELENVEISSKTTIFTEAMFCDCTSLKSVILPSGLKAIGPSAFARTGITDITIPDSVTKIDKWAFMECESLTSVEMSNSVTNIGDFAFGLCPILETITLSKGLVSFGTDVFHRCYNIKELVIPEGVKEIGYRAIYWCTSLTEITIPSTVVYMGEESFHNCESLTKVNYLGTIDSWIQIEHEGYDSNPLDNGATLYINGEIVAEANITTATKISSYAFSGCSELTSLTIGKSVQSIEENAFANCDNLKSIYVDSLETWANINFANADANPLSKGVDLYVDGKLVEGELVIPKTIEEVKAYAFYSYDKVDSIIIEDGVKVIGNSAFFEIRSLTNVTIPTSIESISGSAFSVGNRPYINTVNVNYLGTIDSWVEKNLNGFMLFNLYINGELATDVKITAYEIFPSAFFGCLSLENVVLEGTERIYNNAFRYCENLKSIVIPWMWEGEIGSSAFVGCIGLEKIYYGGYEGEWDEEHRYVEIYNATVYSYVEFEEDLPVEDGNYWHFNEDGEVEIWCDHEYEGRITEPTCTEQGYTTNICEKCGDSYIDNYVNALGHTEVVDTAVAPTCEKTGLTEGAHCSVCLEILVEQQVIDAIGGEHDFNNGICKKCNQSIFDGDYEEISFDEVQDFASSLQQGGLEIDYGKGYKINWFSIDKTEQEMLNIEREYEIRTIDYGNGVIGYANGYELGEKINERILKEGEVYYQNGYMYANTKATRNDNEGVALLKVKQEGTIIQFLTACYIGDLSEVNINILIQCLGSGYYSDFNIYKEVSSTYTKIKMVIPEQDVGSSINYGNIVYVFDENLNWISLYYETNMYFVESGSIDNDILEVVRSTDEVPTVKDPDSYMDDVLVTCEKHYFDNGICVFCYQPIFGGEFNEINSEELQEFTSNLPQEGLEIDYGKGYEINSSTESVTKDGCAYLDFSIASSQDENGLIGYGSGRHESIAYGGAQDITDYIVYYQDGTIYLKLSSGEIILEMTKRSGTFGDFLSTCQTADMSQGNLKVFVQYFPEAQAYIAKDINYTKVKIFIEQEKEGRKESETLVYVFDENFNWVGLLVEYCYDDELGNSQKNNIEIFGKTSFVPTVSNPDDYVFI